MKKKPNFYYTPERRSASDTSEPGGESWDPLLNTCRFFQETGIARECTFLVISCADQSNNTKLLQSFILKGLLRQSYRLLVASRLYWLPYPGLGQGKGILADTKIYNCFVHLFAAQLLIAHTRSPSSSRFILFYITGKF